jgi:hypothetical protein
MCRWGQFSVVSGVDIRIPGKNRLYFGLEWVKKVKMLYICRQNIDHIKYTFPMTITIQINTAEDVKALESLLPIFKKHGVTVHLMDGTSPSTGKTPKMRLEAFRKLHGIIDLPENFDYKAFISDELMKKHGAHG